MPITPAQHRCKDSTMTEIIYTAADIASYRAMCQQADMTPSLDGMIETECQTLSGQAAHDTEAAVRVAWSAYA